MRERLRKISQHAMCAGIKFLGEKTNIITKCQEPRIQYFSVTPAALQEVIVNEPKAAGEKRAFARRQAVDAAFGFVTHDQSAFVQKPTLDCRQRAANLRMIGRQEADEWNPQQARA